MKTHACFVGWASRGWRLWLAGWLLVFVVGAHAQGGIASALQLERAELTSLAGVRWVDLPHALQAQDFNPAGSTVVYRMQVTLSELPQRPLALFIPKLSLSGRIFLNGQFLDSCGVGALAQLRCLHQPGFYPVPVALWHTGDNAIEIEVFGNDRQMNGLSAVWAGDAEFLYENAYRWRQLFSIDLVSGLGWTSAVLGLLSLLVWTVLRNESAFLWFGLASTAHALGMLNNVVVRPAVSMEWFNWLVFSSRLVASPMAILTLLAIFNKVRPWNLMPLLALSVFGPILMWFTDASRNLAIALFLPILIIAPVLVVMSVRWAIQSRSLLRIVATLMLMIMIVAGLLDWMRLAGKSRFDGNFLFPYTYSGMLITMGTLLFPYLATALRQSRRDQAELERRTAERMAYEVTEHIPVGTFTLAHRQNAPVGQLLFMSQHFLDMLGLEREALLADCRRLLDVLQTEDRALLRPLLEHPDSGQGRYSLKLRVWRQGELRFIALEAIARVLPDATVLYEGVLVDETERVQAMQTAEKARLQLQQQQLEQSRMREREQLLRDMHDGFGSQIASVRMMAEKGRIGPHEFTRFLQEIAADLHLVVDTLGQLDVTLEEALADMQYRLSRRFGPGTSPVLEWQVALPGLPALQARTILQILRLIQEALNNALKHAHATRICIAVHYRDGALEVSVSDNGQGMHAVQGRGRGIHNMHQRAREIGAHLNIEAMQPGVCVRLRVPAAALAQWASDQIKR